MKLFLEGSYIPHARHPHILYWFWSPAIIKDKKYLKDLKLVAEESPYTMVVLSARDGMNFWQPELKPYLDEAVECAHRLGLKIVLQLWPQGFFHAPLEKMDIDEATGIVNEGECVVRNGVALYQDDTRHIGKPDIAVVEKSKLLKAFAFYKASDGVYFDGTLKDVTERTEVLHNTPGHLKLRFDLPELEGATVYVMTVHYHRYGDLFSDCHIRDYDAFIERYRETPFDGIVLDEMKNLELQSLNFTADPVMIRERFYGTHMKQYFEAEIGENYEQTLFEMRYTAMSERGRRAVAINRYYDILRRATRRIERFVVEKTQSVYGKDTFVGLHNTFHNHLQSDEILSTGINWWEVPRVYAQTDEDVSYPVRMGIACQCPEALIYDMYYTQAVNCFLEKAMRDAKFGCRLHYHAMNDQYCGADTGSKSFIEAIRPVEEKIDLLNLFDPVLPAMDLLVVFGFPALCNWYPNIQARNEFDINGSLNIHQRVDTLWQDGYLNALAPSDALEDGRITLLESGEFMYGGHTFAHMLFLYPEYSKEATLSFLENAIMQGASLRIIGSLTTDFNGADIGVEKRTLLESVTLPETTDIPKVFSLQQKTLDSGCRLEDGSVVFSDLESLLTHRPKRFCVQINGHLWQGEYEGVAAIKTDENGNLIRLVCGACRILQRDDEVLFSNAEGLDIACV